jgi:ABC-type molybdate transport system substrate-binding protein
MKAKGLIASIVFLTGALVAGGAGAAELKVLSDEAMKPALEDLVKGYEASSKTQVKVDYANAADIEKKVDDYDVIIADKATVTKLGKIGKVAVGATKPVAKKDDKSIYDGTPTNWTDQVSAGEALIAFLKTPKAAEVYKAKGLQPG